MTQDQVAEEMDWSLSKLIRVESGAVGISTNDLRALLQLYGVTDRRRTNEMIELAKAARQRMWWNEYRQYMSPQFMTYVGFEAEAVVIRQFHLSYMPGLFQTEDYVRALFSAGAQELSPEDLATYSQIRLRRGREVLERDDPPELLEVLDESVVRRAIGGPAAMARQLSHLIDLAQRPNITVRVVPFDQGAYSGVDGTFTIYEFADPSVNDVLYLGAPDRDELREAPSDVEPYRQTFDQILDIALSEEESLALIQKAKEAFERS